MLISRQLFYIVAGFGLVLTLTYFLTAIRYLAYPNYADHLEPTVSAISWLGTHGHPVYPDWRTGEVYVIPYGPLLFIINGTVLRLYPTIFASKLAGWTAFFIALVLTYITFKAKASGDRRLIFLLLMIVIVTFSSFGHFPFWSRAEPFLILIGILTVIAALKLPEAAAATAIGILAGLAVDFKLHGAVYAVPAALAVYGARETWRDRIRLAMLSSMGAAIAVTVPFLLNSGGEGSELEGYMSGILMLAKQGWSPIFFLWNLMFGLVLFTPIIFAWYFRRPTLGASESWFLGGLLMSLAMTIIVASKPGAGPHHLLPLVPISVYGLLSVLEAPASVPAPEINGHEVGTMVLASLLISYVHFDLRWTKDWLGATSYVTLQTEKRKIDELQTLYSEYAPAELGLSDNNHYPDTYYRALLVFQGAPLHIDFASWMDLQYEGVPETRIVGFLTRCDVQAWILPEGTPFKKTSYYTGLPLVSENFRRAFFANYELIKKGEFYQVWRCRSAGSG